MSSKHPPQLPQELLPYEAYIISLTDDETDVVFVVETGNGELLGIFFFKEWALLFADAYEAQLQHSNSFTAGYPSDEWESRASTLEIGRMNELRQTKEFVGWIKDEKDMMMFSHRVNRLKMEMQKLTPSVPDDRTRRHTGPGPGRR